MGTKSGKYWVTWADVHAKNSTSLDDLDQKFLDNLKPFIKALQDGGATVDVTATKRNSKRAYLFHWSWKISQGKCKAADAEVMAGVDIEWDHGEEKKSKAGALEMVTGFGLAIPPQSTLPPALNSEHIAGNAVDMDITWAGTIKVKDKNNKEIEVSFMRDVNANGVLHSLGESYGVKKLKNDAPHWSSSGR